MWIWKESHKGGRNNKKLIKSDGDVEAMYWHYIRHDVRPSEWYKMKPGERLILRAFMMKEIEEEKKSIKDAELQAKGGN